MKTLGIILIAVLAYSPLSRASYWAKSYGADKADGVNAVLELSDGMLVAGSTRSFGSGENDCLILRIDAEGEIVWQYVYGGTANEYCTSLNRAGLDKYLAAGNTKSYGSGDSDGWILEFDGNGNILSQKTLGGDRKDYIAKGLPLSGGGVLVSGSTSSFGAGQFDAWLVRLYDDGQILWQKRCGGEGVEWVYDALETSDGGFVVVGETSSSGEGKNDLWILRLNNSGEIIWQRAYGGPSYDWARSVIETEDGVLLVAGTTFSFGSGQADVWVIKLSSTGTILWQKCYGGANLDWPARVVAVSQERFLVAGGTYSFGNGNDDLLLFEIDSDGQILRQRTYGGVGEDYINDCLATDTGFLMAGRTSSVGSGDRDILLLKTDPSGTIPSCRLIQSVDLTVVDSGALTGETQSETVDIGIQIHETAAIKQMSAVAVDAEFCEVQYGDLNADRIVNMKDLGVLASYWLTYDCGLCDGVDMTSDQNVEIKDLGFLLKYWLEGADLTP